ncbi:hypothetical protein BS50DRAFT_670332 [Corynespora cassiicola Philippines]|uniref:EthD domain-containing protein n=1 Tax=Corynespora cassiicola Philippines TaxID=1448308 RepID=A0A2T2P807_CORCC|nr:hypothetical protein BS50DRAFT_670332 [Corynespora cassiicola Philippines]
MPITLLALLLCGATLAAAQSNSTSAWPNPFPKQLAAVRRRQGLTTSEFLYHHTFVHGQKSWNAPDTIDQPVAYVQGHVFDSAYGINTTKNEPHVSYFGHSDMTELYSRSQDAFATPPPNNYTATVIGPDGNAFSDFSASINMYGHETFQEVNATCLLSESSETYNAFYWVFANAPNANTSSFDNVTFAEPIMKSMLEAFSPGVIHNASIHTPVPGLDSRTYYGGYGNPTLNAVLKFWLCDDNQAVTAFRNAQLGLGSLNEEFGIDLDKSFVIFTRAVLMYDRSTDTPFDVGRATRAVFADRFRGNVAGPPLSQNAG